MWTSLYGVSSYFRDIFVGLFIVAILFSSKVKIKHYSSDEVRQAEEVGFSSRKLAASQAYKCLAESGQHHSCLPVGSDRGQSYTQLPAAYIQIRGYDTLTLGLMPGVQPSPTPNNKLKYINRPLKARNIIKFKEHLLDMYECLGCSIPSTERNFKKRKSNMFGHKYY